jgi:hypothetical protein
LGFKIKRNKTYFESPGLWTCGFKDGCFGFVSGFTLGLLSGVPSSFLGFGPGLIASIVLILNIYFDYTSKSNLVFPNKITEIHIPQKIFLIMIYLLL